MAPNSPAARELAERLLASAGRAAHAERDASGPVGAAGQVGRQLAAELSRWFGPYGYHALLTRALTQARLEHAALRHVRIGPPAAAHFDGLEEAAQAHGADATLAGVLAVLATLIDLLGRLIGEDLAMTFIDHTILALAPGAADLADPPGTPGRAPAEGAP